MRRHPLQTEGPLRLENGAHFSSGLPSFGAQSVSGVHGQPETDRAALRYWLLDSLSRALSPISR
jgi:hypothetical protein